MTREKLANLPEFQVLDQIAHSKRHSGKNLEIQQALVDLLAAFPSEAKAPRQPELFFRRHDLPDWSGMVADEVAA
jgi:hypothetical protein